MASAPLPSLSLSLSHSLCVALPLIRVSVPAPSPQAEVADKISMRKWLEESLKKKKALGEGKCSDTHTSTNPWLHTYILQSLLSLQQGTFLNANTHMHLHVHSMLIMTLIQLGPTKESDLSAKITSPLSAASGSSLTSAALCPLTHHPTSTGFHFILPC